MATINPEESEHYYYRHLDAEGQALLLCLAPFTSVVCVGWLDKYVAHLKRQPALAALPFERWRKVVKETVKSGLLRPDPNLLIYLHLQPALSSILYSRLQESGQFEVKKAIEVAFRAHYDGLGSALYKLLGSDEPEEKQLGQRMTHLEYENLVTAVKLALDAQVSMREPYFALAKYIEMTQKQEQGLELGQHILERMKMYEAERLPSPLGFECVGVIDTIARWQMLLKQYAAAEAAYQKALAIHLGIKNLDTETLKRGSASIYRQLGAIAQGQGQWEKAQQYYEQVLQIYVEANDRDEQAATYHQLGIVVQEQRKWGKAQQYYEQALQIWKESDDRYAQAATYLNLGIVAEKRRQWEKAQQYHRQALRIYGQYNDRYRQAKAYHGLGRVAEEQGQWEQAQQHYEQALRIYVKSNDRYSQVRTYHQLGMVTEKRREWMQAQQYYEQALRLWKESNDRYSQAVTYHQLGIVAEAQGQWEQARQYYEQALQLWKESNDRHSQAKTYHQLGIVAEEQGQWGQARAFFLHALEIWVGYRDTYYTGTVMRSLGRLWRASGDGTLSDTVAVALGVGVDEVEGQWREDGGTGREVR